MNAVGGSDCIQTPRTPPPPFFNTTNVHQHPLSQRGSGKARTDRDRSKASNSTEASELFLRKQHLLHTLIDYSLIRYHDQVRYWGVVWLKERDGLVGLATGFSWALCAAHIPRCTHSAVRCSHFYPSGTSLKRDVFGVHELLSVLLRAQGGPTERRRNMHLATAFLARVALVLDPYVPEDRKVCHRVRRVMCFCNAAGSDRWAARWRVCP